MPSDAHAQRPSRWLAAIDRHLAGQHEHYVCGFWSGVAAQAMHPGGRIEQSDEAREWRLGWRLGDEVRERLLHTACTIKLGRHHQAVVGVWPIAGGKVSPSPRASDLRVAWRRPDDQALYVDAEQLQREWASQRRALTRASNSRAAKRRPRHRGRFRVAATLGVPPGEVRLFGRAPEQLAPAGC